MYKLANTSSKSRPRFQTVYVDQSKCKIRPTHHVKVSQGAPDGPEQGASLDSLDPQPVGEQHAEDGNTLVIIRASNRARYVAWHYGYH